MRIGDCAQYNPCKMLVGSPDGEQSMEYLIFHHLFIKNPGVPVWWRGFCLSFDVVAAAFLAVLVMQRSGFASKVYN